MVSAALSRSPGSSAVRASRAHFGLFARIPAMRRRSSRGMGIGEHRANGDARLEALIVRLLWLRLVVLRPSGLRRRFRETDMAICYGKGMSSPTARPNHTYSVEFRLYGDDLDPAEVSSIIGLQATTSSRGEPIGSRPRLPFWGFNGSDDPQFQEEWQSLEDGLALVSRRLKPHRSVIAGLLDRFDGLWWCGHFQSSFDGGPTLSPRVLADVASFGCPFFLDNYHAGDDDSFQPARPVG
jgi:hypothetical protein